jgi:threonine/homoserine/homoserine lactone efflux protein
MKGYRKLSVIYATLLTLIILALIKAPPEAYSTLAVALPFYFVALGVKYWRFKFNEQK